MTYIERLLPHLAKYRRDVLGIAEPGLFRHRGRELWMEHILPKENPWLGIPSQMREQVRSYCISYGIKLHRYFHHLNSSQAFALSLFVPFFEGDEASRQALLRSLGTHGALVAWKPEHVPDANEGTNLDAWWSTSAGAQYFCEVKLTEPEFGVATDDEAHRKKLETIYAPRLRSHVRPERLAPAKFFEGYQILRQVWHAASSHESRAVFIYPKQRTDLTDTLESVLNDISDELRNRVIVVYAEDILGRIIADESCPTQMKEYAEHIAAKYLLKEDV